MNKTVNTIVFIVVATAVNIAIMLILAFVPFILIIVIFKDSIKDALPFIFMILISGAFIGGFFIYNFLLKLVMKKIDFEKYIHPILSGKRKPPRTDSN